MARMADTLINWPWYQPISNRQDWLHPTSVGRQDAIELLSESLDDGTFLIRQSQKKRTAFVLSMCFDRAFYHFVVETRGIYVFLDAGPYMISLEHLVDHYSRYPDGLPCVLRHPISVNMVRPFNLAFLCRAKRVFFLNAGIRKIICRKMV